MIYSAFLLRARLKALQGKLPVEGFQKVVESVLEQAFNAGSNQVAEHVAAAGGQG